MVIKTLPQLNVGAVNTTYEYNETLRCTGKTVALRTCSRFAALFHVSVLLKDVVESEDGYIIIHKYLCPVFMT
jgi:hypothetical protein